MSDRMIRVWDPLVRLFHWGLVASFAIAWVSADNWDNLHEWAGYAAASLILIRIIWSLIGTRHARATGFIRSPRVILAYLGDLIRGREARYIGHNPAGGIMILALVATMTCVAASGWMQTTDVFWGVDWIEELHETLANLMLALVGLHLAGVVLASLRHGENLATSMVTGRKRAADIGDID